MQTHTDPSIIIHTLMSLSSEINNTSSLIRSTLNILVSHSMGIVACLDELEELERWRGVSVFAGLGAPHTRVDLLLDQLTQANLARANNELRNQREIHREICTIQELLNESDQTSDLTELCLERGGAANLKSPKRLQDPYTDALFRSVISIHLDPLDYSLRAVKKQSPRKAPKRSLSYDSDEEDFHEVHELTPSHEEPFMSAHCQDEGDAMETTETSLFLNHSPSPVLSSILQQIVSEISVDPELVIGRIRKRMVVDNAVRNPAIDIEKPQAQSTAQKFSLRYSELLQSLSASETKLQTSLNNLIHLRHLRELSVLTYPTILQSIRHNNAQLSETGNRIRQFMDELVAKRREMEQRLLKFEGRRNFQESNFEDSVLNMLLLRKDLMNACAPPR